MILKWIAPDGTELTFSRDATDYKLTKNYTGLATIPVRHMTQTAPYQDGTTRINSQLTTRAIGFEVMIMAPDLETLQARIRALAVAFTPTAEGHLYFTNEAGTEYWIAAMGNNTPSYSIGDRAREYQRAYIDLIAFDPFWYSGDKKIANISTAGTNFFPLDISGNFLGWSSSTTRAVNDGDLATPITLSVVGECVTPIITNTTTGEAITINLSMAAGDKFVITTGFGNKTATYYPAAGGSANGFPYIGSASVLWNLEPGDNVITLGGTSIATGTYVKLEWYDKYIAV